MKFMADKPDNFYDLAIIDPPYGIGMDGGRLGKGVALVKKNWDSGIPDDRYFSELFRVSKNQIIWGGNYFGVLWPCRGFIVWDKRQWDIPSRTFADSELAWTSFDINAKTFRFVWDGFQKGSESGTTKIHPTQKAVKLYEWLLLNYAKEGDKILDTHGGSGSICIACHNLKFDLDWCELDQDYFEAAKNRFEWHKAQLTLF